MVVLVLFALWPPVWVSLLIVSILALAQFFSLKFVHPVRTVRWRPLSLTVMFVWTGLALWVGWTDFEPTPVAHIGLLLTSLYLLVAGILQQIFPKPAA